MSPRNRLRRGVRHWRRIRESEGFRRVGATAQAFWYELVPILALGIAAYALWLGHSQFRDAIHRINVERARNVRLNCQAQNERHDRTIEQLDALISRLPPAKRTRAVQSRAGTVLLINALAPKQNCQQLAARQVKTRP